MCDLVRLTVRVRILLDPHQFAGLEERAGLEECVSIDVGFLASDQVCLEIAPRIDLAVEIGVLFLFQTDRVRHSGEGVEAPVAIRIDLGPHPLPFAVVGQLIVAAVEVEVLALLALHSLLEQLYDVGLPVEVAVASVLGRTLLGVQFDPLIDSAVFVAIEFPAPRAPVGEEGIDLGRSVAVLVSLLNPAQFARVVVDHAPGSPPSPVAIHFDDRSLSAFV